MKRSMYAGRVRSEHVGQEITLKGCLYVYRDNLLIFFISMNNGYRVKTM